MKGAGHYTEPGVTKRARPLVRSVLMVCLILSAVPCVAQEADPDPPTAPQVSDGLGTIYAPSAWLVLNTPVQKSIDLKIYGFYIGKLDVPVAQVDVTIRATKFLTFTPSYLYYSVPPSGLDELFPQPGNFSDSYREHQARIDGTVSFAIDRLEVAVRNMYVRRFRPSPADDINRYRGRIGIALPVAVHGRNWKLFSSYETFYERNGAWNRDRYWAGVTLPLKGRVAIQPSYLWENNDGARDIDYLLVGLIVNTR